MALCGLFVYTVISTCILFVTLEASSETTVDIMFSQLNDRLDSLDMKMNSIETEIRTSVESLNQRIGNIENLQVSQSQSTRDFAKSKRKKLKQKRVKILKALEEERAFVRNILHMYEDGFHEFKYTINGQIGAINKTVETIKENMKIEYSENTTANSSLENEPMSESATNAQDEDIVDNMITTLDTKMNKRIAFYGYSFTPSGGRPLRTGQQIMFEYVLFNVGEGYSNEKGQFIAPKTGLYLLHLRVDGYYKDGIVTRAQCQLHVYGHVKLTIDSQPSERSVSGTIVTHMYAGRDEVYVTCLKVSMFMDSVAVITISAVLIN